MPEKINQKPAWLVSWNVKAWNWDDYEKACANTKQGKSYTKAWACFSTKPQVGDEVFLIKLGSGKRGIIGHGYVIKESYEDEHFDDELAESGHTAKFIDIEFDRIINYKTEKMVSQEELHEKCSSQQWSPQASGIRIKDDVIANLRRLWNAVLDGNDTVWVPSLSEYDPGLSENDYKKYLDQIAISKGLQYLDTIYYIYTLGGAATCKQLEREYDRPASHFVSNGRSVGKWIAEASKCPVLQQNERLKYWPVLFTGKNTDKDEEGAWVWRLRSPLFQAVTELDQTGFFREITEDGDSTMEYAKNMILYGPPGTGKTYNSVIYAVAICEGIDVKEIQKESYSDVLDRYNALKSSGRIEFTTFHQSYGYEEFIEGIKPVMNDDGNLSYTIEDGAFKTFCKRASAVEVHSDALTQLKKNPHIWGVILGGTKEKDLPDECYKNGYIKIGFNTISDEDVSGDFSGDDSGSWNAKHMVYDFIYSMEIGDIVVVAKSLTKIDAIGIITGDYEFDEKLPDYCRKRNVKWLCTKIDENIIPYLSGGRKQLARSTVFSFDHLGMEGVSKIASEYSTYLSIDVKQGQKPYVFIIDEINRGNISKIFGELITLIEDTKRAGAPEAMEATLPYSGETFSVPANVYILGTMNTADRSIALMDTALRRRFEFVEMMPDPEVLDTLGVGIISADGVELNVKMMLYVINQRIEYLYDREHTIGHAFFTRLREDPSIDTLAEIFEKKVIPLLQEYFYEDYEKIQLVLGDNGKEDQFKFIRDEAVKIKNVFNGNPDIDLPEKRYIIQKSALHKIQSYKGIAAGL